MIQAPYEPELMHDFLREVLPGIDMVYAYNAKLKRFICEPHVATQAPLLKQEDVAFRGITSELPVA